MALAPIWSYLNALSETKDASVIEHPEFTKEYQPFIVNRALSYHIDAILAANVMNEHPWLDSVSQFLYFLNTLRPRRRMAKWIKNTVSDDVRDVAEYYDCSLRRARDLVSLHTSDQLTIIHRRLDKGGATTRGRSHEHPT
jgi:hypothetical protein